MTPLTEWPRRALTMVALSAMLASPTRSASAQASDAGEVSHESAVSDVASASPPSPELGAGVDHYDSIVDTLVPRYGLAAIEWMRIGVPLPLGIGGRYFVNRIASIDLSMGTAIAVHGVDFGLTVYPALLFPRLRITPFFFFGYSRYRFGATIDNALLRAGLDLSEVPEVAFETRGTRIRGVGWRLGLHVRTRRANFVELSYGRFHQTGASRGENARQGVVITGLELRTITFSVGTIVDWRRR